MIVAELNEVTSKIIDSGISVHKFLGAGLLEKVYQECLHYELSLRGLKVQSELNMPLNPDNSSEIVARDVRVQ